MLPENQKHRNNSHHHAGGIPAGPSRQRRRKGLMASSGVAIGLITILLGGSSAGNTRPSPRMNGVGVCILAVHCYEPAAASLGEAGT